jgi:hypothetical protein
MNDNVTTFLANLKHDILNNQSVEVGSGIFKGQELVDVANALSSVPILLEALKKIERLCGPHTYVSDLQHIAHTAIKATCK